MGFRECAGAGVDVDVVQVLLELGEARGEGVCPISLPQATRKSLGGLVRGLRYLVEGERGTVIMRFDFRILEGRFEPFVIDLGFVVLWLGSVVAMGG